MLAILKTPLFWRIAPLLGLTSGVQIGIQTLWAGPWLRDVMGLTREEVAPPPAVHGGGLHGGHPLGRASSPTGWAGAASGRCR